MTTINFPIKSNGKGWDLEKGSALFYSDRTAKGSLMAFGCEGELYGWTKTGRDDKDQIKFISVEIPIDNKHPHSVNEKIMPIINRLKEEAVFLLKKQIGEKFDEMYTISSGVRCTLVSGRIPNDIYKVIKTKETGYAKFTDDRKIIGVKPVNIGFYGSGKYITDCGKKRVFTNIKINIFHRNRKVDMEWVQDDRFEDSDDEILDEDMVLVSDLTGDDDYGF